MYAKVNKLEKKIKKQRLDQQSNMSMQITIGIDDTFDTTAGEKE